MRSSRKIMIMAAAWIFPGLNLTYVEAQAQDKVQSLMFANAELNAISAALALRPEVEFLIWRRSPKTNPAGALKDCICRRSSIPMRKTGPYGLTAGGLNAVTCRHFWTACM